MTVKLYYNIASPSARAVILTIKALGIPYELKQLDLLKKETLSEDFLQLNPQHTVPTLQDEDGFVIWESHAINAYLVNKYAKNDKLYPKEPKARAIVDQRLHFDNGVLFTALRNTVRQILFKKTITKMTDELTAQIEEGYEFLEKFLAGSQYAAGDDITIADFSIITTLGNLNILTPIKKYNFPRITEYLKFCESNIPNFRAVNEDGLRTFTESLISVNFKIPPQ